MPHAQMRYEQRFLSTQGATSLAVWYRGGHRAAATRGLTGRHHLFSPVQTGWDETISASD